MDHFKLVSQYAPTGDQPQAIEQLVKGFKEGNQFETLLGVTGSGKTFTMANVIQALNKPTLIISHNKTLAGQLYGEMKEFFPENAVEYFVSYYDYYQPEAYVPQSDTYIAKDSAVNDEIDKLRLSATAALAERKDVIIVASVSCIYGIGSPDDYMNMMVSLRPGMEIDRDDVITGKKQCIYFSMEFLIGRLMKSNLENLGVRDLVKDGFADYGIRLEDLEEQEPDAGLGNGGLGRLAACFLDSAASLGLPMHGNTIRYEYGFFRQKFVNGRQMELPDEWLSNGFVFEVRKPKHAVEVEFGGQPCQSGLLHAGL